MTIHIQICAQVAFQVINFGKAIVVIKFVILVMEVHLNIVYPVKVNFFYIILHAINNVQVEHFKIK